MISSKFKYPLNNCSLVVVLSLITNKFEKEKGKSMQLYAIGLEPFFKVVDLYRIKIS